MKLLTAFTLLSASNAFLCPSGRRFSTASRKQNIDDIYHILPSTFAPIPLKATIESPTESNINDFEEEEDEEEEEDDETQLLLDNLNELTQSFEIVQNTIQENKQLYESKLVEYEDDIAMLKEEVEKQLTGVMIRDNDIKELKAALEEVMDGNDEAENYQQIIGESGELISMLEKDLLQMKGTMQDKDTEMKLLKAILVGKEKEIVTKTKELEEAATSSSNDGDQNRVLSARVEELEKLIEDKDAIESELKKYEQESKDLKQSLDSQKSIVDTKEKEIDQLKSNIESLMGEMEELQTQKKELQDEIVDAKNGYSFKEESWTQEKKELLSNEQQLSDENERLTKSKDKLRVEQSEWLETERTFKIEKDAILKEKDTIAMELSSAVSDFETERTSLMSKIEALEEKVFAANDTKLRKDIIDVQAKSYTKLMDVKLQNDTEREKSKKEIDEIRTQLEIYEQERKSLRKLTALGLSRVVSPLRRNKNSNQEQSADQQDPENED